MNQDIKLNPNERIYIFSKYDIDILAEKELFDYLKSEYDTTSKFSNCKSITQLKKNETSKRNVGNSEFINILGLLADEKSSELNKSENIINIQDKKISSENENSDLFKDKY